MFATIISASLAAQDAPPPLSAYGELPAVEDAAISESGDYLAFVTPIQGERTILVLDRAMKPVTRFSIGDAKLRSLRFVGDETLLLVYSQTEELGRSFAQDKYEFSKALLLPVDPANKMLVVFSDQRKIANAVFGFHGIRKIDGVWTGHFGGLEYVRDRTTSKFVFNHGRPSLFAVDLRDGTPTRVARAANAGSSEDWLVDEDGEVAATFEIDKSSGRWKILNTDGDRIASDRNRDGSAGIVGLGHDGSTLIYRMEVEELEQTNWFEVPLDGSSQAKEIFADVDIERTYWDRSSGRILGYLTSGRRPEAMFYSADHQAAAKKIIAAFPDMRMRMVEWTPDFRHVLVRTSGNGDSGSWFIVDVEQLSGKFVAAERRSIPAEMVGPISTVNYNASDGLEMDGILTLPPGREAKDLPAIMLPHGGPHSQDREEFDWLAQAFASRGYAVFQPNFRGSTNRGASFIRAGYGQWGRAMQTDISDGLAELTEAGIVDPARVCIVGASYGGYAALAGVTLQQNLYRCAVSVAGVSDLKMMKLSETRESGRSRLTIRSLDEELGPASEFSDYSPRRAADRADAPIMLIHGKDDTVVLFEQSAKMADALDDADKPHELVVLEEEDHWLSRSATRQQMLEAAMRFVKEHNPPD